MATQPTSHTPKSSRFKKFFKKNWGWIVLAGVILVAGITGAVYVLDQRAAAQVSTDQQVQTAVARLGDLSIFASGVGQVTPASEISLGFDESGTLIELPVQVGDRVEAGQVLARLQTSSTEADIAAAVAAAELTALNAQKNLDDLLASAPTVSAQALLAVEEAQQALDDLLNPALSQAQAAQAVAVAQQNVDTAQVAYNRTHMQANQMNIDTAYAALILAREQLERAQDNFERYADKPEDNLQRANAQTRLSTAQYNYDTAAANYNAAIGTASAVEVAIAEADLATSQAELASAQRELERVKNGASQGEIALAKAQLAAAQVEWEKVKTGLDPQDVAIAKATLANAQAELEQARTQKAVVELTAPVTGTILSIANSVGEQLGASGFITLADLDQTYVLVYLDESDLDMVKPGYEAEVVFDAVPDLTYKGKVVQVDPSLANVSNVSMVKGLVLLDTASLANAPTLPVGLNASVDIIGGKALNAVLVPVEALRELSPGEYAVFVMVDGKPRLRAVTVGLMDITSAEILSGLEAGEVVTTGVVETTSQGN